MCVCVCVCVCVQASAFAITGKMAMIYMHEHEVHDIKDVLVTVAAGRLSFIFHFTPDGREHLTMKQGIYTPPYAVLTECRKRFSFSIVGRISRIISRLTYCLGEE